MTRFDFEMPNIYDAVFFSDTLAKGGEYASLAPRNHESLFFVTNGTLLYQKDGKCEMIEKGQVGYIARGSVDVSGPYKCPFVSYMAVDFCFDRYNSAPQKSLPFKTVCCRDESGIYEKLFQKAADEYSLNLPGKDMICQGILLQILGMLYNECTLSDLEKDKQNKLEAAINCIRENYQNPDLKISELASVCNFSEKHFRRLFSEVYQKNPAAFLQDFRLNKAKILLLNTSKSVSEIALFCGFSDVYSFSHCFKNNYGISPLKYRNL